MTMTAASPANSEAAVRLPPGRVVLGGDAAEFHRGSKQTREIRLIGEGLTGAKRTHNLTALLDG